MELLIILLIVLVIFYKGNEAKRKGIKGEKKVNNKLKKLSDDYITINDIMLRTEKGTTQIDHIVVSAKGIFVIETKNYEGWIYGDENSKYWTQILYKTKNNFYNPIWQNKGHVTAIKKTINNNRVQVHSIVAFGGSCKLKKVRSESAVIYINQVKRYINKFKSDNNLSKAEIEAIVSILTSSNITDRGERKKHIKYVKKKSKY